MCAGERVTRDPDHACCIRQSFLPYAWPPVGNMCTDEQRGGTGSTVLSSRKRSLGDLVGDLILACEVRSAGHLPVTKQRVGRGSDHVGCACTALREVCHMHAVLIGHPKLMAVPCSHGQGEQGF